MSRNFWRNNRRRNHKKCKIYLVVICSGTRLCFQLFTILISAVGTPKLVWCVTQNARCQGPASTPPSEFGLSGPKKTQLSLYGVRVRGKINLGRKPTCRVLFRESSHVFSAEKLSNISMETKSNKSVLKRPSRKHVATCTVCTNSNFAVERSCACLISVQKRFLSFGGIVWASIDSANAIYTSSISLPVMTPLNVGR